MILNQNRFDESDLNQNHAQLWDSGEMKREIFGHWGVAINCMAEKVKPSNQKSMTFLGCFSTNVAGSFAKNNGIMKNDKYIKNLYENLKQCGEALNFTCIWLFKRITIKNRPPNQRKSLSTKKLQYPTQLARIWIHFLGESPRKMRRRRNQETSNIWSKSQRRDVLSFSKYIFKNPVVNYIERLSSVIWALIRALQLIIKLSMNIFHTSKSNVLLINCDECVQMHLLCSYYYPSRISLDLLQLNEKKYKIWIELVKNHYRYNNYDITCNDKGYE